MGREGLWEMFLEGPHSGYCGSRRHGSLVHSLCQLLLCFRICDIRGDSAVKDLFNSQHPH